MGERLGSRCTRAARPCQARVAPRWSGCVSERIRLGESPIGNAGDRRGIRHRGTESDQREALAKLKKLNAQRDDGIIVDPRITVAGWLDHWLTNHIGPPRHAPKTVEQYRGHVTNHIVPAIGHVPLAQLHTDHIEQLHRTRTGKGLEPSSVASVHRVLRAALSTAEAKGQIPRNVARYQPPPAARPTRTAPPGVQQPAAVFTATEGTRDHAMYVVLAHTGLRIGEALAMHWDDLDLGDVPTLTVARRVVRADGTLHVGDPKIAESADTVSLTPRPPRRCGPTAPAEGWLHALSAALDDDQLANAIRRVTTDVRASNDDPCP